MANQQPPLDGIFRELGALREAVDSMTKQWRQQEDVASESRRQLYNKFEDSNVKFQGLRDEVRTLGGRVDQMGKEIAIIQPDMRNYNDKRLRDEGARHLGKILWGAMLTAAGLMGWAITHFLGSFFPGMK